MEQGRKRMGDGVAGDAKDAGGLVKLLDAVKVVKGAGGNLPGGGFRPVGIGSEGKRRAGSRTEHAADEAFLAPGNTDDVGGNGAVFNEAQDGEIVGQRPGGGDYLDEFGLEGFDAVGGLRKAACARKVMKTNK